MHQSSKIGFWRGLGVAAMLARRDVKNRYASSYAGVAWNIGVPLVFALVNVVVFSVLLSGRMGARYSDVPFSLFYFVPYSLWILFFEVVGRSSGVLREYSYLINKISFPVWVLPLVPLASAFLSQLVIFLIVTFLLFTNGLAPDGGLLAFVLLWALTIVLAIGVSYLVSSISVYVPDMGQLVPILLTITFWLTPILYPVSIVEERAPGWVKGLIITYNPFYYLAETARSSLFGLSVHASSLLVVAATSLVALGVGGWVFRKLRPGFADVL
jgi:ABC-type polysaccharide/polyol phosphate export permease